MSGKKITGQKHIYNRNVISPVKKSAESSEALVVCMFLLQPLSVCGVNWLQYIHESTTCR